MRYLSYLYILFICPLLHGQQLVSGLVSSMDSLMQESYPEKIYLATDRPFYAAGDTVWISGWLLDGSTLRPSDKSRMLHVELVREDGSILRHLVLECRQGVAFGQVVLPGGIPSNTFLRLRAYTRWSMNFPGSYRFGKLLPVVQFRDDIWQGPRIAANKNFEWVRRSNGTYSWKRKSSQVTDTIPVVHPPVDLRFLPEGGRWVCGFPCNMAFKAVSDNGHGMNLEGEIIDDRGLVICPFTSLHRGMGSFFLTPQPGRTYQARLFNGDLVDLPQPDTAGVVMTIKLSGNDSVDLQCYFSPDQLGRMFYLVSQSRGKPVAAWEVRAVRTRITRRLPLDGFLTGIARFTLFTGEGVPCNERLLFVNREDGFRIRFTVREQKNHMLELGIDVRDARDYPVKGVFTVSVADSLYGVSDPDDDGLYSRMLLSGDLSGHVESPGWYFRDRDTGRMEALDLVMRTHGWSGYAWDDVYRASDRPSYTPEREYSISGRVTNLRNKPVDHAPVSLWVQGARTILRDTLADGDGRFFFGGILPLESSVTLVRVTRKKGKSGSLGMGLELDPQPVVPSPATEPLVTSSMAEQWEHQLLLYRNQRQADSYWLDSLLRASGSKYIEAVTVEAKRPVKGSYNLNGPGHADKVLYEEDIRRYSRYDRLLDILKGEFPQLEQESWKKDRLLWELNKPRLKESYAMQPGKSSSQSAVPRHTDLSMKRIAFDYPVWRMRGRTVIFSLNGRILPVGLPAEDTLTFLPHPVTDSLSLIAMNLWNIPAKDIAGIELIESSDYVWPYSKHPVVLYYNQNLYQILVDQILTESEERYIESLILINRSGGPSRPCIIEVTTYSGSTNLERVKPGSVTLRLQGFILPKQFYVPQYYPKDISDRAIYDVRPVLYWNPEVVTDEDGHAGVRFPVGPVPRGLQIRMEGTDLKGGIGSKIHGVRTEGKSN